MTITHKDKTKKPASATIIPRALPRTEREVIIHIAMPVSDPIQAADYTLKLINKAITESADITVPPFTLAHITTNNRVVLMTNPTTKATAYAPYLQFIADATKCLKPIETKINECWSKFLLHNVPVDADPSTVKVEIESTYPSLHLGQDPCWLVPMEYRFNKTTSMLVIALIGAINYKHLGTTSLAICNRLCRIQEYFSWNSSTQCNNCQKYGHHPRLCKADQPTCTVCAQQHTTKNYPCTISTCCTGGACTHPPLQCTTCGAAHKANDPLCPVCAKNTIDPRYKAGPKLQDKTMKFQV
jgi:hypothetical protein